LPVANEVFILCAWAKWRSSKNCPNSQRRSRQEIRLRLAELDSEDWLDDEDSLTDHEKALLDARLAAYAKDPDAGSTWEEVEGRIQARLSRQPNG
jgi:hypothetical protein